MDHIYHTISLEDFIMEYILFLHGDNVQMALHLFIFSIIIAIVIEMTKWFMCCSSTKRYVARIQTILILPSIYILALIFVAAYSSTYTKETKESVDNILFWIKYVIFHMIEFVYVIISIVLKSIFGYVANFYCILHNMSLVVD